VYEFYFASCMNIVFNELRQQRVKYNVHTTSKIKHTRRFYHILFFIASISAISIWNYFVMCSNTIRRAWVGLLGHDSSILIGFA